MEGLLVFVWKRERDFIHDCASRTNIQEVIFIATYVISDIHGQYDMFIELLDKIQLQDTDMLYILGDILDRGPYPIKTLMKLMEMPNAICLVGNHELMALECLEFLMKEIIEMSIEELDEKMLDNLVTWQYNGSKSTINEFRQLDSETRRDVIDFIKDFLIYEEIAVNGKNYLLVHAGLGNYLPDKDIEDYSIHEIIWTRADYDVQYFKDTYVVTGHTPTQTIKDNLQPGYIYRRNNNIAIDCGASTISTFLSQWQMDFLNQISRTSSMETINREAVQMTLSNHEELIAWIQMLPSYFETENQIFVHAGVDEEAEEYWMYGTSNSILLGKFPATKGKFYKTIVAGHVGTGTWSLADDRNYHDVFYDGESHYYILHL